MSSLNVIGQRELSVATRLASISLGGCLGSQRLVPRSNKQLTLTLPLTGAWAFDSNSRQGNGRERQGICNANMPILSHSIFELSFFLSFSFSLPLHSTPLLSTDRPTDRLMHKMNSTLHRTVLCYTNRENLERSQQSISQYHNIRGFELGPGVFQVPPARPGPSGTSPAASNPPSS